MRKLFLLSFLLSPFFSVFAQDSTATKKGWKRGGVFSVNLAQGGSQNWAAGAERSSFSTATFLNLFANKECGKYSWANNLDLNYALVNTSSLGSRKTDDRIDFTSRLGYAFAPKIDFSLLFNLRTQFTDGFDYNYEGTGKKKRISGLFAPAYITLAPGITWKPNEYFSLFFSPASARWVVVSNAPYSYFYQGGVKPDGRQENTLAVLFGVDEKKQIAFQLGAYASMNYRREIMKNVVYKTRLDLYSNYLRAKRLGDTDKGKYRPANIDVFWTNLVAMQVNKWLSVTYSLDIIYDDDVRQFGPTKNLPGTQIRSLLGVGLATKF
jgi:hypothetical protein